MSKFTTKIISGKRVTIPKNVCELLDLSEGDFVDIDIIKARIIK